MKKYYLIIALLSSSLYAYTIETLPNPTHQAQKSYVANPDAVLSAENEAQLRTRLELIKKSTTNQVSVVIVNSIDDQVPKQFATALFNKWGIGEKGKDNGLLILLVMDQRRIEIEVGYGLEGSITDLVCHQIIQNYMIPQMKAGNVDLAVNEALNQVEKVFRNEPMDENQLSSSITSEVDEFFGFFETNSAGFIYFIFIFMVAGVIVFAKQMNLNPKQLAAIGGAVYFIAIILPMAAAIYLGISITYFLIAQRKRRQEIISYCFSKTVIMPMKNWEYFVCPLMYICLLGLRKIVSSTHKEEVQKMKVKNFNFVPDTNEDQFLTNAQKKEEELGSVEHEVYFNQSSGEQEVISKVLPFSKFSKCTSCNTIAREHVSSHTIVSATYSSSGSGVHKYECKHCQAKSEVSYVIAQLQRSSSGSSSGSRGGGSSFGGGRSGGGGAGGSW